MIDSTPATDFTPPANEGQQVVVITPPAFGQLPKETQRRIWENWRRQEISTLSFKFWAATGVDPKIFQEDDDQRKQGRNPR